LRSRVTCPDGRRNQARYQSTLTVFRRGTTKDLSITIAEVEADKPAVKTSARDEKAKPSAAGQAVVLAVSELSDAQKKELKIKGGVKVDGAIDAAARAGLREGDMSFWRWPMLRSLRARNLNAILTKHRQGQAVESLSCA
jgi:hypothetical protein